MELSGGGVDVAVVKNSSQEFDGPPSALSKDDNKGLTPEKYCEDAPKVTSKRSRRKKMIKKASKESATGIHAGSSTTEKGGKDGEVKDVGENGTVGNPDCRSNGNIKTKNTVYQNQNKLFNKSCWYFETCKLKFCPYLHGSKRRVHGKNVLKKGLYNWTLTVDHYPSDDWSGLIVGVVEVAE